MRFLIKKKRSEKIKCEDESAYIKKEPMAIIVGVAETEACAESGVVFAPSSNLHYGRRFVGGSPGSKYRKR